MESDSSDAAEDLADAEIEDEKRSSADDTDDDPVWKPKKPKLSFGSGGSAKVTHLTREITTVS